MYCWYLNRNEIVIDLQPNEDFTDIHIPKYSTISNGEWSLNRTVFPLNYSPKCMCCTKKYAIFPSSSHHVRIPDVYDLKTIPRQLVDFVQLAFRFYYKLFNCKPATDWSGSFLCACEMFCKCCIEFKAKKMHWVKVKQIEVDDQHSNTHWNTGPASGLCQLCSCLR